MNFAYLNVVTKKWDEILVIGRDIKRDGKMYHMIGMTLAEEAKLYLIEPYQEEDPTPKRGVQNQRKILKEHRGAESCYLQSRYITIGNQRLTVLGATGDPLKCVGEQYGTVQIFMDMINAGWKIPEWLREEEWSNLQLISLELADVSHLPKDAAKLPIVIGHDAGMKQYLVEKAVTLNVGQSRTLSFTDVHGEKVDCYINNVMLIDVWEETMKKFNDEQYTKNLSEEGLEQIKNHCIQALEQNCPKGMCYVGIEYECTKNISAQFYSKEYLRSVPGLNEGGSFSMGMSLKPDVELGTHQLPLRGYVIQTAVTKDTEKIAAELFCYYEQGQAWEESI